MEIRVCPIYNMQLTIMTLSKLLHLPSSLLDISRSIPTKLIHQYFISLNKAVIRQDTRVVFNQYQFGDESLQEIFPHI